MGPVTVGIARPGPAGNSALCSGATKSHPHTLQCQILPVRMQDGGIFDMNSQDLHLSEKVISHVAAEASQLPSRNISLKIPSGVPGVCQTEASIK